MTTPTSAPLDAFLRGVDRRAELHAGLLAGGRRRPDEQFELRPALPGDTAVLNAIALRDGVPVPPGPLLLAEAAGVPIAAIGLENRRMIADPTWPTDRAIDALQAAAAEHPRWPGRLRRMRAALQGLSGRAGRRDARGAVVR
ncbi:hypothetical protein [Patulibacter minatonensis]|uniref:hypothetical protein n=1 Tax=Patulibacter minatonensis TaxID=298163 RepID=UPI00047C8935|nr:hypothetical protein [Patulibacter minatonensis]